MRFCMIALWVACMVAAPSQAAEDCGALTNEYGPFDYRSDKDKLASVETNRFDSSVENLVRAKRGSLGGDIDYTLRAFPNHHRALASMRRLGEKLKTDRPPRANYTVYCYFDRAVRFRPDDGTVRVLYALYLAKQGKGNQALLHMHAAENSVGENANLHYNMGVAYADLREYEKALNHAHRAQELGFTFPGLRNKLVHAGKWREPEKGQSTREQTAAPAPDNAEKPSDARPTSK